MRERGLCVDHTTIYRWVQRYAPEIDKRCRPFLRRTNDSYRIDETYVRVAGAWTYLYRGVDSNGDTLDFLLRATRDRKAAIAFFRKTLGAAHTTPPRVVTVDKNPAYPVAFEAVRHEGLVRPRSNLRQCKYLNNIIEAGPPIHQTPHPADAGLQAIHHGVADLARHRDHACAPQGTGAMDGEGRRGRADAADPQGVRIGRVTRSTQRILARDPKPCNRTPVDHSSGLVFRRPPAALRRRAVVYFYAAVLSPDVNAPVMGPFERSHQHGPPLLGRVRGPTRSPTSSLVCSPPTPALPSAAAPVVPGRWPTLSLVRQGGRRAAQVPGPSSSSVP